MHSPSPNPHPPHRQDTREKTYEESDEELFAWLLASLAGWSVMSRMKQVSSTVISSETERGGELGVGVRALWAEFPLGKVKWECSREG